MGAFHAYDIRGVYNVDFDRETVYKTGFFLPELLSAGRILVGRDCRISSQEIHDALIEGITDAGADVVDIGLSTTPMVYFATARHGFKASVQITASHNPPQYNGLKVSREDALPVGLDSGLGQIRDWIESGRETVPAPGKGSLGYMDVTQEYIAFLNGYMSGDIGGLKVAFDLSNGMACLLARRIFGDSQEYIFDTMDGSFPNHDPNPLVRENVLSLEKLVNETGADAGVIYDGDADRVMFVDEKGHFVAPDLIIALLGHYFVGEQGRRGKVLQEIRCSKAVSEYLVPMGCQVETWKVGRANAAVRLRGMDGLWGGELAGHYYFKDFFYSDSGMLASILVLRVLASMKRKGISFSSAVAAIARYENSGEINFRIDDKQGAMDALRDYFSAMETPSVFMDFDGYRLEFGHWWFNVRPSNTEPYLRFLCEADSRELLDSRLRQVKDLLCNEFNATLV